MLLGYTRHLKVHMAETTSLFTLGQSFSKTKFNSSLIRQMTQINAVQLNGTNINTSHFSRLKHYNDFVYHPPLHGGILTIILAVTLYVLPTYV